jgi:hypothetical protein
VNTFGIGSSVDQNFIKRCAKAGKGHFYFIKDYEEIKTKVIESLNKNYFEYLSVKEIRAYDEKY